MQKIRKELLEQKDTKPTFSNNYRRGACNNNQYNYRKKVITTEPRIQILSIITRTAISTAIDLTRISNPTKDFPEKIHFGKMNMLLNNSMSMKTANSIETKHIVT